MLGTSRTFRPAAHAKNRRWIKRPSLRMPGDNYLDTHRLYKSLLEESGYNVALFDVDAVRLTSCALRTVTGICFSYGEEQNRYYLNEA